MTSYYTEVPAEAPKPKLWKSLGHVMTGLEAHYALDSWNGDMDLDREIELRDELIGCAMTLHSNGQDCGDMHLVKDVQVLSYPSLVPDFRASLFSRPVPARRQLMVRFVACDCLDRPVMRCS